MAAAVMLTLPGGAVLGLGLLILLICVLGIAASVRAAYWRRQCAHAELRLQQAQRTAARRAAGRHRAEQGVFAGRRRHTDAPVWQSDLPPARVQCEPRPLTDPALREES